MITPDPPEKFTKRRIARLSEQALRDAGVVGDLPTPMEAIQEVAGIRERVDISDRGLPKAVVAKKPSRIRRVLGALAWSDRTVYVDRGEPPPRVQFTDGHEAIHALCRWHEPTHLFDDDNSLGGRTDDIIESEANYGAAQLIFQGGRFHKQALREQVSIRTPLAMHCAYGASRHVALHHYVEDHPDALALIVAGRYPSGADQLPVWRSVESSSFLERFGRLHNLLPGGVLSIAEDAPLAEIVQRSRTELDPPTKTVTLPDMDQTRHRFEAEAFFNGSCFFVLVIERKARRLGRRVRLAS